MSLLPFPILDKSARLRLMIEFIYCFDMWLLLLFIDGNIEASTLSGGVSSMIVGFSRLAKPFIVAHFCMTLLLIVGASDSVST